MIDALHRFTTSTLSRLAHNRAEQVMFSRFLHNRHVHLDQLIYGATQAGRARVQRAEHAHLLVCSDTTEINVKGTQGDRQGNALGVTGNNNDPGFFIHAGLALDADQGRPLGCVSLQLWTRGGWVDRETPESEKWFKVTRDVQGLAPRITLIHDREGDIYDLWVQVRQRGAQMITRARQDRALIPEGPGDQTRLWAKLEQAPRQGCFALSIRADQKKRRAARKSQMELRFTAVSLRSRGDQRKRPSGERVKVNAIEVRERAEDVPPGEQPVVWRLLTSHPVTTVEQALQIVQWYLFRWRSEDTFSALKTRCVDVEASRLESGLALMKLAVMSLWSAAKMTELVKHRDDTNTDAREFFLLEELVCLQELLPLYEGKTQRQQNPYPVRSIAWAIWIVARLGHWHGSGQPGLQIVRRGLERFDAIFLGWNINHRR
ncbi:IS4 family transposase [Deinococcus hopiensis]|uniref:IS4 family transposase n=1 Tax=Deinococcus hopiensis TaxID=309885 RepID=UPI0014838282|nr:IS4 family transposase [Deinococcus hopiensis]